MQAKLTTVKLLPHLKLKTSNYLCIVYREVRLDMEKEEREIIEVVRYKKKKIEISYPYLYHS